MSRELLFDGYWEGAVEYCCDHCHKTVKFRFDDEESAKNHQGQRKALQRKRGWKMQLINGHWFDFCGDQCMIQFVKRMG